MLLSWVHWSVKYASDTPFWSNLSIFRQKGPWLGYSARSFQANYFIFATYIIDVSYYGKSSLEGAGAPFLKVKKLTILHIICKTIMYQKMYYMVEIGQKVINNVLYDVYIHLQFF